LFFFVLGCVVVVHGGSGGHYDEQQ